MRRPPKTALCPQIKTGLKSSRASLVASPSLGTNAARGRWGLGHVLVPPTRSQTQEWAEGRRAAAFPEGAATEPRSPDPAGLPVRLRAWGHLLRDLEGHGGRGPDILGPPRAPGRAYGGRATRGTAPRLRKTTTPT